MKVRLSCSYQKLNEDSLITFSSQSEDKANEKYSIDKLMRLQRAMSGINGGLPKSKAGHRRTTKTSFQLFTTREMLLRDLFTVRQALEAAP